MKIPINTDPLAALIDKAIVDGYKTEERNYLGASSIGDECARKLWYRYNGEKENFDAKTIKRFLDGHRSEDVIVGYLRSIPQIEFYSCGPDGDQIGFSEFEGRFAGHYDGIGRGFPQAPATWHIVEIKCVEEKSFNELKKLKDKDEKTAILNWKPVYYSQVQVYMHKESLTRSIHIVCTPGVRDLISVRTNYDKAHAEAMMQKAKRIIDATEPPEKIGKADFYLCKMCAFWSKCHGA